MIDHYSNNSKHEQLHCDGFKFSIVHFSFICDNIPASKAWICIVYLLFDTILYSLFLYTIIIRQSVPRVKIKSSCVTVVNVTWVTATDYTNGIAEQTYIQRTEDIEQDARYKNWGLIKLHIIACRSHNTYSFPLSSFMAGHRTCNNIKAEGAIMEQKISTFPWNLSENSVFSYVSVVYFVKLHVFAL